LHIYSTTKEKRIQVPTFQTLLEDKRGDKKIDWRGKKRKSLLVADSFKRIGLDKKAERVRFCGSVLAFHVNPETGEKRLHDAQFCRERLCPMCQWRKSIKLFYQVSKVLSSAQRADENLVPVFLTLTVRNCTGELLPETLNQIFAGWYQLTKHRKFMRICKGWFRALEITYNRETGEFHPHVHAILMVEKSYFKGLDYMKNEDWRKMWKKALKTDYLPICDIRKVKGSKAVSEVAKYTVKDSDFLTDDEGLTDRLVEVLERSLKGRRLFAFGGLLKLLASALGADEPGEGDLIHTGDEIELRPDVAYVLEVYRWRFGLNNYVEVSSDEAQT